MSVLDTPGVLSYRMAKAAYEHMIQRYAKDPNAHPWVDQPEAVREDWCSVMEYLLVEFSPEIIRELEVE